MEHKESKISLDFELQNDSIKALEFYLELKIFPKNWFLSFKFQCIAKDPRFDSACLNPTVLDIAYFAYKQKHKPKRKYKDDEFDHNAKYRYIAYRQFVRYVNKLMSFKKKWVIEYFTIFNVFDTSHHTQGLWYLLSVSVLLVDGPTITLVKMYE